MRDRRVYQRDGRYDDGGSRPRYSSRVRYRHDGPSYSGYRTRHYYTSYFDRPRFVYRSGFSIGFAIGLAPSYGYHYFDPYCDTSYHHLGAYYDHCHDHGHPEVILVVDAYGGDPYATCVYEGGDWVVDDCYYEGY